MLKTFDLLKELESEALHAPRLLLEQVPTIQFLDVEHKPPRPNQGPFASVRISLSGEQLSLLCTIELSGQPRHVRVMLLQLRNHLAYPDQTITPVLIAPGLSADAQAICLDQ